MDGGLAESRSASTRETATDERLRALVAQVREYAVVMLDAGGHVTSWNSGAERIKGYRADEILGRHLSSFYPPEAGSRAADEQLRAARREGHLECEGWRLRKDGQRFWASVVIAPMLDAQGGLRGYLKITRDMTERKQAEEDLRSYANRLMSTSRRLLGVQEAERRRLAGDLHDRVGPNLTALGIRLELLENGMSAESRAACAAVIEDCKALLQETVDATRAVMGELRPQVLVDYGLVAALRAMASGFARRTGIHATVHGADGAKRLAHTVELAMFRIAQEALNNVGKHSRAKSVAMRYATQNGIATLEIHDDGIGFKSGRLEHAAADSGWGLIIMRERAEVVGARLTLEANPGRGVHVRVSCRA
jgi:PAS domain S-box-containing protein